MTDKICKCGGEVVEGYRWANKHRSADESFFHCTFCNRTWEVEELLEDYPEEE